MNKICTTLEYLFIILLLANITEKTYELISKNFLNVNCPNNSNNIYSKFSWNNMDDKANILDDKLDDKKRLNGPVPDMIAFLKIKNNLHEKQNTNNNNSDIEMRQKTAIIPVNAGRNATSNSPFILNMTAK